MDNDAPNKPVPTLKERSTRYLVFLVIFLTINEIYDTYTTQYPSIIVDLVEGEFGLNSSQYAFFLGIITIGTYFAFISQYLADRIGRKIMLFVTLFGMGFASMWVGLGTNVVQYAIASFFLYIFFSSDIWTMYMVEESPKDHRGKMVNLVLVGGCIGALLVPGLFDALVVGAGYSWRSMTWFAMLAMGFAFITLATKETRVYDALKQKRRQEEKKEERRAFIHVIQDFKQPFLRETRLKTIILITFGFVIGMNYMFILMGKDFLVNVKHLSQDAASDVILFMGIAAIVGYLINGFLLDKIGRKKTLILFIALFPASIIIAVLGDLVAIYISVSLISASFWNLGICSRIYCQELYPTAMRGQITGWRSLFYAMGSTAGALIGSIVLQYVDLGVLFIINSFIFLPFIPIIWKLLPETRSKQLLETTV
nr:MFS transporter [Candidatus Sigynarchaeota archaeon]